MRSEGGSPLWSPAPVKHQTDFDTEDRHSPRRAVHHVAARSSLRDDLLIGPLPCVAGEAPALRSSRPPPSCPRPRSSSTSTSSLPAGEVDPVGRGTSVPRPAQARWDVTNTACCRPESVYPTPTPDKSAAKCRKDVCLLPDCNCGGKDIPGASLSDFTVLKLFLLDPSCAVFLCATPFIAALACFLICNRYEPKVETPSVCRCQTLKYPCFETPHPARCGVPGAPRFVADSQSTLRRCQAADRGRVERVVKLLLLTL